MPGVAGDNPWERAYLNALRTGGLDAETELYDWTQRQFWITNLQAYDANRAAARGLASYLTKLHREKPDRPLLLTCDSGGAGPLVWALEALPDDVAVDGIILLAPALSHDYDLTRALRRVRKSAYVFWSPGDGLVLDFGTRMFGTIDGKRAAAAGSRGFATPADADLEQYRKLVHVKYEPTWFGQYGNPGDHVGAMTTRFASGYLAPLLTDLVTTATDDAADRAAVASDNVPPTAHVTPPASGSSTIE
ncbi:MAG TPA: hypothetical protein VK324_00840 [Tepidisphaeraceae bacterium]|nr:hypothetical protein [Tepidisphaeraceae bacterium]